jgi:hypothetical protein
MAHRVAFQGALDLWEQGTLSTVNVGNGQITVLTDLTLIIADQVGK